MKLKYSILLRCWLLPVLALLGGCTAQKPAIATSTAETTIYIVRHAEKDLTPGLADPPLTPAGQQRALALRDTLRKAAIDAVFSTATSRTRATATPLASRHHKEIVVYDARQLPTLAARIRREYRGRAVLVVGHSNTILETVEALGAAQPVPTIGDNDYDYLLEVRIPQDSTRVATAVARRYGAGSSGR